MTPGKDGGYVADVKQTSDVPRGPVERPDTPRPSLSEPTLRGEARRPTFDLQILWCGSKDFLPVTVFWDSSGLGDVSERNTRLRDTRTGRCASASTDLNTMFDPVVPPTCPSNVKDLSREFEDAFRGYSLVLHTELP